MCYLGNVLYMNNILTCYLGNDCYIIMNNIPTCYLGNMFYCHFVDSSKLV